jgi:hypothetical protein
MTPKQRPRPNCGVGSSIAQRSSLTCTRRNGLRRSGSSRSRAAGGGRTFRQPGATALRPARRVSEDRRTSLARIEPSLRIGSRQHPARRSGPIGRPSVVDTRRRRSVDGLRRSPHGGLRRTDVGRLQPAPSALVIMAEEGAAVAVADAAIEAGGAVGGRYLI